MPPRARALRAMVEGRAPWTGHDVLVVTAADAAGAEAHRRRLGALFGRTPLRVLPVVDARLGNLTGTVDAWRAVRAELDPGDRVALVHDAGQATRSGWVTRSTGGSRGALRLGATVAGQPVDLLGLVALGAMAWAGEADGMDVFWGSQLALPRTLEAPSGWLCKQGRPLGPLDAITGRDLHDLGWIATDADRVVRGFAAQRQFHSADALGAWAAGYTGAVLADFGSARFHRELLDALETLYADRPIRRDLDPHFTRPWVRLLAGGAPEDDRDREVAALMADPRFARPEAVCCRAFEGPWVRLRRPEEFRRALVGLREHPELLALWGVDHPVRRSWLGDTWIEGPELTEEAVAAGVTVGGVRVEGAVVRDSRLAAGSDVRHSWVWACSGQVEATESALVEVGRSGRWEQALHDRDGPEERPLDAALVEPLERAPRGSDPRAWAALVRDGCLCWRRGEGSGPPARVEAPRGADGGQLVVRTDRWPRLDTPDALPMLLEALGSALSDPAGRALAVPLDAPAPPAEPAARVAALDAWSPESDPFRLALGALLEAGDGDGPIRDLAGLRAAWRIALERDRCTVASAWARIGPRLEVDPTQWIAAGQAVRFSEGAILPAFPVAHGAEDPLETLSSDRAFAPGGVLGLCGPAAAGKSTLCQALEARAADRGLPVVRIHADRLTFAGPGFRYTQRAADRVERLEGPGIYDDRAIRRAVDHARHPDRLVLVDGVFLGLDPAVRAAIDRLVLLVAPVARRLADKRVRDSAADAVRTVDIETDLARKLFREDRDCMGRLAAVADRVLGRPG